MPRLAEVPTSDKRAQHPFVKFMYQHKFGDQEFFTAPGSATGVTGNCETVVAQVPSIMEHCVRGFDFFFSPERILDPFLRELSVMRAAWAVGSQFVFSQHCKCLRAIGGSEKQIEEIKSWQISNAFTQQHRAVLAYSDSLSLGRGVVSDGVFEALRQHLSEPEILELTYGTLLYIGHSTMMKALRLEYDDRDDPIIEVPAPNGYVLPPVGRWNIPT
jgi:alkylhydroperoxidase family enzyme